MIISKYDQEKNINKTVTFLGKGDAFGDLAILNNTVRETTVITKEKTEFLVITHSVGYYVIDNLWPRLSELKYITV